MKSNRFVAIGDIHGCARLLRQLLLKIERKWRWDYMVFLGDYIDRGRDSKGVVEQILQLQQKYPDRIICLKGNHEQWMLEAIDNPRALSWLVGMNGFTTIASYDEELCRKFRQAVQKFGRRLLGKTPQGTLPFDDFFHRAMPAEHLHFFRRLRSYYCAAGVIFAHAGVAPGIPIEYQRDEDLLWIGREFYEEYREEEWVVVGHSRTDKLRGDDRPLPFVGKNRILGLDTGSFDTGVLTACLWPEREFLATGEIA